MGRKTRPPASSDCRSENPAASGTTEAKELVAMEWIEEADGVFRGGGVKGLGLQKPQLAGVSR
jgi:hypothetical protein